MKSKATLLWFMIAVTLAAAIWLSNLFLRPNTPGEKPIFAGLRKDRATAIEIIPAGAREISVVRTNESWMISTPIVYPAQAAAIDGLLAALQTLTPVTTFTAGEMSTHKNADSEFGFDNPQFKLNVTAGDQTWHLNVGNKTAPGDGVYVRVVGTSGASVTDTAWLNFLPHDVNGWRDTTLVDVPDALDRIIITNGTQVIDLARDPTNGLWRMIRPMLSRANNLRIDTALQQLRAATVSKFVTDDAKADLTTYGLEPSALDLWFGSGTNSFTAIHVGKEAAGAVGEVYARREGFNSVVTTAKFPLSPWQGTLNDFRDPYLMELTAPVAEIEVHGDFNFSLQSHGTNKWNVVGEKFPVDAAMVASFAQSLARLQITNFVQDVVTPAGLKDYGLAPNPVQQVTLRSAVGDTNSNLAQLLFGASTNGLVYARRADEPFVYAVPQSSVGLSFLKLPPDFYRDHRIWYFSETNVAQVTVHQNGKVRQLIRTGTNEWTFAGGSQGMINSPAVEEAVHRLGDLSAYEWYGRNQNIGLTTNSLTVSIDLKSGGNYSVSFGPTIYLNNTTASAAAAVTLDGQQWEFLVSPTLWPLIDESLTIPANTP